jgi:hypothetical protein
MTENEDVLLVFGSEPQVADPNGGQLLGARRIPVDSIRQNLASAMKHVGSLMQGMADVVGDLRVEHVDIQLGVSVDGSIGLMGTGVSSSVAGTFVVRLTPPTQSQK